MATQILLIEDEAPAAARLEKMILQLEPDWHIAGVLDSVESAVDYFRTHPQPDLVFMDIQLADGESFDIFRETEVTAPVIFITAFDQYAIKAFKVNSVDYLLKPLKEAELTAAIDKFKRSQGPKPDMNNLLDTLRPKEYQKRFVLQFGQHIKTVEIADAAYFFLESKITLMVSFSGQQYPIDPNLDHLERMLDPAQFFRLNRQYIISHKAIKHMYTHTKSRVIIEVNPPASHQLVVSSERSAVFKKWLAGGSDPVA